MFIPYFCRGKIESSSPSVLKVLISLILKASSFLYHHVFSFEGNQLLLLIKTLLRIREFGLYFSNISSKSNNLKLSLRKYFHKILSLFR